MIKASLRYFGAVVQHGSIRAAADALHIAQSAVSRQLQSLEQELDVQLIERRARGIVPTPAGELLYRYCRDASFHVERLRSEIDALQGLRRGNVRIATVESLMTGLLPDAIDKFRAQHPGITFEVMMSGSDGGAAARGVERRRGRKGLRFRPGVFAQIKRGLPVSRAYPRRNVSETCAGNCAHSVAVATCRVAGRAQHAPERHPATRRGSSHGCRHNHRAFSCNEFGGVAASFRPHRTRDCVPATPPLRTIAAE